MTLVQKEIEQLLIANNLKTPPVTNVITGEEVTENTQASVDALSRIEQFLSTSRSQSNIMDTTFHDQFDTHLCHSYAIVSAFRQVIRTFLSGALSVRPPIKKLKLSNNKSINDKDIGDFSFHRVLTAFVMGVNPRSFAGLKTLQSARTDIAISRLVHRTAFEIEGWKKMIPVRDLFKSVGLKVCPFSPIFMVLLFFSMSKLLRYYVK